MAGDDFDTTVDRLYAGPADRFIADRDDAARRARAAGDRDLAERVKRLRRPTVAAALLNRYRRSGRTQELEALEDLGTGLRAAQLALDAPTLRSLSLQRGPRIAAVVEAVAAQAGEELTAGVREQLIATLTAAVADVDAARAVSSGRLVTALSYSGIGQVDMTNAVAAPRQPDGAACPGARATGSHDSDTGETGLQSRARHAAAAADAELTRAAAALEVARAAEDSARRAAELADRALAAAERTARAARARADQAEADRSAAEEAVTTARGRLTSS